MPPLVFGSVANSTFQVSHATVAFVKIEGVGAPSLPPPVALASPPAVRAASKAPVPAPAPAPAPAPTPAPVEDTEPVESEKTDKKDKKDKKEKEKQDGKGEKEKDKKKKDKSKGSKEDKVRAVVTDLVKAKLLWAALGYASRCDLLV